MRLFVPAPAAHVTGGPEALHQLVHKATDLGFDAAIVYHPADHPEPTAEVYRCYQTPVAAAVEDASDAFVVVPEIDVPRLLNLNAAQRGLWWLSVDNFLTRNEILRRQLMTPTPPLDVVYDPAARCIHLAQSEYARGHLKAHGSHALMLTDYIRPQIVELSQQVRTGKKDDIVVYNPLKGKEFTEKLIGASPASIQWVPLQDLTPSQVSRLLGRAKVYIDFGNHPGRDRIPREAALCGCAVITGSRGSAGNSIDVPIRPAYRFDDADPSTPERALSLIKDIFKNYTSHHQEFAGYRAVIEDQENVFTKEVFTLLSTIQKHMDRHQLSTARG
jgi:hypothetical protein